MVSQAGTIALAGLIPIVHSFSCFLTSRASEQIYNNCTQGGKVIYVGSLAGILPGGPGASHQAIRDVAAMSAMPGLTILEPVCAAEVKLCLDWAINENAGSTYLRLTSIPIEKREEFNKIKDLKLGLGHVLREGGNVTILSMGPLMSVEALKSADKLSKEDGIEVKVIVTSWANINGIWLKKQLGDRHKPLIILENHFSEGGFAEKICKVLVLNNLVEDRSVRTVGIEGLPKSGTNKEVLEAHRLDFNSIAELIKTLV
jgi:transketolase